MPKETEQIQTDDGRINLEQQDNTPTTTPINTPQDKSEEKLVEKTEEKLEEKDEQKVEEISFEDFTSVKDLNEKEEFKKPDDKKEEKKEEKSDDELEVSPGDKGQGKAKLKDDVNARDLSDIDEAIAPHFKRMSNEAFAALKPLVKEHKQLKAQLAEKDAELTKVKSGALPDSYYDNPRAVVLHPEFEKLTDNLEQSREIAAHWKKQLIAVKKGDNKYQHLTRDSKGNFVLEEVKVTDETETDLQDILTFANNQISKFEGKIESLVESHKIKTSENVGAVRNITAKTFPVFDDPEKGKSLKPLIADTIKAFPPAFHNHPLMEFAARSLITNHKLKEMIDKLLANPKNGGKTSTVKDDKRRSGPTAGEATGGTKGKVDETEITIDDFNKVKE